LERNDGNCHSPDASFGAKISDLKIPTETPPTSQAAYVATCVKRRKEKG